MKTKKLIIPIVALGLAFAACEDNMNYNEYTVVDKEFVELTFGNVGGFMSQLYKAVDYDFGNYSNGAMQASATDESEYSKIGNAIEDFYNGGWSATNAKGSLWTSMFTGIRAANHFLEEFQNLDFEELKANPTYKGELYRYQNYQYEARFLRAYFYFLLVRQYGGVPIMDRQLPANEANSLSRNTSDEVFQFIIDECDAIKDDIIKDYSKLGDYSLGITEGGRADRMAVLALRARAALYWASPLFNPANDNERWYNAAVYSKAVIDECAADGRKLATKYEQLWASDNFTNPRIKNELIFCYRYYKNTGGDNLVETNNYPVGIEDGKGGNCPTQNLVDAYDMKNGKAWDEPGSGYDASKPYDNRDPRMEATVAVNGDVWPTYQKEPLQTYHGGRNGQPMTDATTTGYYLKKLCNGAIDLSANSKYKESYHVYLNFRLGGVYLDYAEAAYRYFGDSNKKNAELDMTALEAVNVVRKRAKVGNMTATGDEFWERYKKERMVELAFEGHRFWDVRRWKEADKYFKSITRMNITLNADNTYSYERKDVSRQWDDKMYLFPIPRTEIIKNPNLEQNTGW